MEIVHQGLSSEIRSSLSFQNTILIVNMLETFLVFGFVVVCSDCLLRSGLLGFGRVIYLGFFFTARLTSQLQLIWIIFFEFKANSSINSLSSQQTHFRLKYVLQNSDQLSLRVLVYKMRRKFYYWEVTGSISLYAGWTMKRSKVDHHFKRKMLYFFIGNFPPFYLVLESQPAKVIIVQF